MVKVNIPLYVLPSKTKVIRSGGGILNSLSSEAYSSSEDSSLTPLLKATIPSLRQHNLDERSSKALEHLKKDSSPCSTFNLRSQMQWLFSTSWASKMSTLSTNLATCSIMAVWVLSTASTHQQLQSHCWSSMARSSLILKNVANIPALSLSSSFLWNSIWAPRTASCQAKH